MYWECGFGDFHLLKSKRRVNIVHDDSWNNRSIALLFEDLLTVRCKQETAEALTFESEEAFASAFEVLGIVSMEKLIEHPTVISASENVINYIDLNKLSKIFE